VQRSTERGWVFVEASQRQRDNDLQAGDFWEGGMVQDNKRDVLTDDRSKCAEEREGAKRRFKSG